ncbi:MAG: D-alanine--poly(phosphoribitol) ligase subunit 2 [Eubacteriaceae bacterium]|jgi:D-alanine--poly(phosphoribitol) ligase subunit 2|nr:D-alanine--poly(phosphoribitol) ligase subunit 2 [Eubacteriaceae bacterium]
MEEKILDMLADICGDEIVKENPDIDLMEEDLMDSLDWTELLVWVEEEFGAIMSPSEYTREEMNTPNKVIAQVKKRLEEQNL